MSVSALTGSRRISLWGFGVAALTLALMIATEPWLAIVWDEGYTLGREERVRAWLRGLANPVAFARDWSPPAIELVQQDGLAPPRPDEINTRAKLLSPRAIAWFWPFGREEPHGHPPFYAIVGLAGDLFTPGWALLPRGRLGPMLLFSLTAGALWTFVARRWGTWPATLSAGAWVLQANLFANGHYATVDAILSSLWLLAVLAFARAARCDGDAIRTDRFPRWGWAVLFGALCGCAADTKLTGWFLPIPFVVWTAIFRDRRAVITLAIAGLVAALTLYAFNPPWWAAPVDGVRRFFQSNLNRGQSIPIPVLFLGRIVMTPNQSLPWYNTLAWTALVTPVGFLALAIAGIGRVCRRPQAERFGLLAVGHWAFLLLLRAMPHTPGHDGVRQFLPAFGLLALVAGLGAALVVSRFGRWGKRAVAVALAEAGVGLLLMMPVPLSYFTPAVGGLPGATRLGMEPTYFWDALSDRAIDWLNQNTPRGDKVAFATFPTSWIYLRDTGRLRAEVLPNVPGTWRWYVLQNRPGAFRPLDRALIARGQPAFVEEKWGVPLIWIFPYTELDRVSRASSAQ